MVITITDRSYSLSVEVGVDVAFSGSFIEIRNTIYEIFNLYILYFSIPYIEKTYIIYIHLRTPAERPLYYKPSVIIIAV